MKKNLNKNVQYYYILMIIACCAFTTTSIGIGINCFGLFIPPISTHLSIGIGTTTLIITITSLCSAFFSPIISRLLAKYEIRFILSIGIAVNAVVLFLFSMSNSIYLFYLLAIFFGMSMCCFSLIPVTLLINNWFFKKNGLVTGICLSFSGVAGAFFNPIINSLIAGYGWRLAFIACSLLILILALPFSIFAVRLHPRQIGLTPYGAKDYFIEEKISNDNTTILEPSKSLFIACCIYATLLSFSVSLNPNLASFARNIPVSTTLTSAMVSAAMLSNVISKILLGILCDKFNAKIASSIMILIAIFGFLGFLQITPNSKIFAITSAFLFGFLFAANAAGIPLLLKETFGSQNYTKVYSIITIFTSSSYAIGVSMIGFSYDFFLSYQPAIFTLLIIAIANLIILFLLQLKKTHI